jgi:predicted DNA-binding protein (MmcQ/YjbR family)
MNIEELRTYCLSKNAVTEGFPFGPETLVFKIGDKIFLLTGLDNHPLSFNVKCDPEWAVELREQYPHSVIPGYHMNKKHWNTIIMNGELNASQIKDFIDHSYNIVLESLPKKIREQLSM